MRACVMVSTVLVLLCVVSPPIAAQVVPPGDVEIIFNTVQVYDALIVSGTLVFARDIGDTSARTIVITNGDFVLAAGGVVSQVFDLAGASTNGADGMAGLPGTPDGGNGGNGTGYGNGGNGGGGQSGIPPLFLAGAGGAGGAGGDLGGAGGNGGAGGTGGTDPTGMGTAGGAGGAGGNGGAGATAFEVTICNATCGGQIIFESNAVDVQGGAGGSGGNGNNGGMGGNAMAAPPMLMGGAGGAGGNGGNGGGGGAGGTLTLSASNGMVRLSAGCEAWVRGGAGGAGGAGGNGGAGGLNAVPPGGSAAAGAGGNGGNAGNGGAGGTIAIVAGAIYTNAVRVAGIAPLTFAGGAPGMPGAPGLSGAVPPVPGTPGSLGSPGTLGSGSLLPDLIAPTALAGTPLTQPPADAALVFDVRTDLTFDPALFADNMTRSNCLRQTVQVVATNATAGAALGTPLLLMRNTPANAHTNFVPPEAWTNRILCFRFLTYDAGDNVRTSVYATHTFTVVPEPVFGLIVLLTIYNVRFTIGRKRRT